MLLILLPCRVVRVEGVVALWCVVGLFCFMYGKGSPSEVVMQYFL